MEALDDLVPEKQAEGEIEALEDLVPEKQAEGDVVFEKIQLGDAS